jgi:hypothetical protein
MPAAVSQNIRWNTNPPRKSQTEATTRPPGAVTRCSFAQRDHRIGNEVENELRCRAIECCIGVRQPQRVRNLEHDPVGRGMGSRESHVGRRDVSADDAARRPFPRHRIGDAARGTSNVQKAAVTCELGEFEQWRRQLTAPSAEKTLVGRAIRRVVARAALHRRSPFTSAEYPDEYSGLQLLSQHSRECGSHTCSLTNERSSD